jgi:hypothetical protein
MTLPNGQVGCSRTGGFGRGRRRDQNSLQNSSAANRATPSVPRGVTLQPSYSAVPSDIASALPRRRPRPRRCFAATILALHRAGAATSPRLRHYERSGKCFTKVARATFTACNF